MVPPVSYQYHDRMDISSDDDDIEMITSEDDENINPSSRKRPQEDALRPQRNDAGNVTRRSRIQKEVPLVTDFNFLSSA